MLAAMRRASPWISGLQSSLALLAILAAGPVAR
jgi:hypothetical protein